MMHTALQFIIIPLIAALIGWLTNKIAILMLFYPIKPYVFWGIKIQGIFPKRQEIIAQRIGTLVEINLFSEEDIKNQLFTSENIQYLKNLLNTKIERYLNQQLGIDYPVLSIFIGKKKKEEFKHKLLSEFDITLSDVEEKFDSYVRDNLSIKQIVTAKIKALQTKEVNDLMNAILKTEFVFIEWIGAILGGLIGIVQVMISYYLN